MTTKRFDKSSRKTERGQAIILIAFAVMGLFAMVGLMIDGGIMLLEYGRLKRAVDAAAISAALQFREGFTIQELTDAAVELLLLNQVNVEQTDIVIETCETNPGDPVLCTDPPRKLVRVFASEVVDFGFMPVLGIPSGTISTAAIGEAASVDVVIVLDASASMSAEGGGDPNRNDVPLDDPSQCNLTDTCHPFREIKDVAIDFVGQLFLENIDTPVGYDRVGIVTFDRDAHLILPMSAIEADVINAINDLDVFQPPACNTNFGPCLNYPDTDGDTIVPELEDYVGLECPRYRNTVPNNPSSCTSSNIGDGLRVAGNEFAEPPIREDSLWVVILLAGGPANTGVVSAPTGDGQEWPDRFCPPSTWASPFCRDASAATRHDSSDTDHYDADDYARDMADFVADPETGQGAVVFAIGLGNLIQNAPTGDPDAGEQLLRYAAEQAGGASADHGSYYFAPTTNQLLLIFRDIAEKIATRLSQ